MILKRPSLIDQRNKNIKRRRSTAHQPLKMKASSCYLPKDNNPERPEGEDAHFICEEKKTIGVADGVGGWSRRGIDAGKYARRLMRNCVAALDNETKGSVNPKRVLGEAYFRTFAEGSSTACVITLTDDNLLKFANVGDSGLMIFRDNKLFYSSPLQQHSFNHPYQLGTSGSSDTPSSSYGYEVAVKAGDIVVAGTDGWLDNMFPSEVIEIFDQMKTKDPEYLASSIAENALFNALDDDYTVSPFSEAAKLAGLEHEGGKYDDITVIVAAIE